MRMNSLLTLSAWNLRPHLVFELNLHSLRNFWWWQRLETKAGTENALEIDTEWSPSKKCDIFHQCVSEPFHHVSSHWLQHPGREKHPDRSQLWVEIWSWAWSPVEWMSLYLFHSLFSNLSWCRILSSASLFQPYGLICITGSLAASETLWGSSFNVSAFSGPAP